jgi:hypothetical protein
MVEVILEFLNLILTFGIKLFKKVITFKLAGFKANLYVFDIAREPLVTSLS